MTENSRGDSIVHHPQARTDNLAAGSALQEKLAKVREVFLRLGDDPRQNIEHLTALCGTILNADTALYNRLEHGLLVALGRWNTPSDFPAVDDPEGHICTDVIRSNKEEAVHIRNLHTTPYALNDQSEFTSNLRTYFGRPVKLADRNVGALCALYTRDFSPTDEDEALIGIIAAAIAVEEKRRNADEQVRRSESKFRQVYDYSPVMMFSWDADGIISDVNLTFLEETGYAREELIGKPAAFLTFPNSNPGHFSRTASSDWTSASVHDVSLMFHKKNGEKMDVLVNRLLIFDPTGRPLNLGVVRNVTEQRRAEHALHILHLELEQRVDMRTRELQDTNAKLKTEIRERLRVEESLRQRDRDLSIRNRIADVFLTKPDDEVYSASLDIILDALGSHHGLFGYVNQEGDLVCPTLTASIWDQCRIDGKEAVFTRDKWAGAWGEALKSKTMICRNDPAAVPEGHIPVEQVLCVPLVHKGELIGSIVIGNKGSAYDDHDIELMKSIAGYIAPVLSARRKRDVLESERDRALAELSESRRTLQAILDASPIGIGLIHNRRIEWANPAMGRLFGFDDEHELVGKSTRTLYPSDKDFQRAGSIYDRVRNGIFEGLDVKLSKRDGEVFDGHIHIRRLESEEADEKVIVTVSDISWRKQAERTLRLEKLRFQCLAENAPFGISKIGMEGAYQYVNPKFTEMFGWTLEDIPDGKTWFEKAFPDPSTRGEAVRQWIDDFSNPRFGEHSPRTFALTCNDGSVKLIKMTCVGTDNGEYLTVYEDVTAQNKAREILLQTERLKAISELSSGVAHNFNNLLQIIVGNADLAFLNLELDDPDELRTNLDHIKTGALLGSQTVKRLQSFAKLRSDIPSEGTVFDLSEVIYRAVEMSKTWWQTVPQKRGIKIAVQTDLDPECLVLGREGEIFEVIINIIKNAVEALPRGGNILIETCREDGRVKARIRDNGHGIPEPHLRKVFEPFFTTKGFSSAGMGLSSSYGIIAAHQGELSVQSTLGQGSAFTICLPALRRQKSYESTPSTHEKNALSPLTILVIDDMPAVLTMLDRNLGALGWRTLSARSGVEGLRLFRGNRCDVVICDAGMPHMNGWEVGRRLRLYCHDRQIPKPPFILLSGWGDTVRNMEESGVDTVVEKPIDMAKLLQAIRGIGVAA